MCTLLTKITILLSLVSFGRYCLALTGAAALLFIEKFFISARYQKCKKAEIEPKLKLSLVFWSLGGGREKEKESKSSRLPKALKEVFKRFLDLFI